MELVRRGSEAHAYALTSVRSLLNVLAHTDAIDRGLAHDCRILSQTTTKLPWLRGLSLTDTSGRVVCSTSNQKIDLQVSDRPYFNAAMTSGRIILSDYTIGPISDKPIALAAQPVFAADHSVRAVLIATLNLQWLDQLIPTIARQPGAAIALVNGQGNLIRRYPEVPNFKPGTNVSGDATIKSILSRDHGEVAGIAFDGLRRIGAFQRLPQTDTRLLISVDENKVLGQIDRDVGWAYLQFAIVILIALLAAWIGGERLIVAPIRMLAQAVTQLGRGDLNARMPRAGWVPELAQLANAFDEMTQQLAVRERELRAANRHYEELASRDSLSGLANRRAFDSRLKAEWLKARLTKTPLGLLLFDVDHFKAFNDHCGHLEGDTCLRQVADALASVATGPDDFAARYGGDEFALLLPGVDEPQAIARAERLRKAIDIVSGTTAGKRTPTISVGAASIVPGDEATPESLIAAADMGLYAAKDRGRDTVVGHAAITLARAG